MPNRLKAEQHIFSILKTFDKTGYNEKRYTEIFSKMSNADFDTYMKKLRAKEAYLVFFMPNEIEMNLTTESLLEKAKKYGIELFEYLNFTNMKNTPNHKTPIKYLVIDLPFKRQSQNLIKKISIPEHNKSIDTLTYQPTGESKGARISYPELQLLVGLGLEHSIDELIRFRGGDKNGFAAYNAMINKHGYANIKTLNNYSTGVESTKTLKSYLTACHLSNTI